MKEKMRHEVFGRLLMMVLLLSPALSLVTEAQSPDSDRVPQRRIALRTNLLYDATLSPNIGVDVRVDSTWTVGLLAGINAWDIDKEKNKKWRHMLFSLRARKFLNDSVFHKGYIEADVIYSHFNVGGSWPVTGASRLRPVLLWAMPGSRSMTVPTAARSSATATASSFYPS